MVPFEEGVDMFTTVVIGNSETKVSGGYLITKRGYSDENKGAEQA